MAIARPTDFASLVAWWSAYAITGLSDGAAVAAWPDSSGNGRDLAQATGGSQPIYKTGIVDGVHPVVRFDGAADFMDVSGAGFPTGKPCTIVVLAATDTVAAAQRGVTGWNTVAGGFALQRTNAKLSFVMPNVVDAQTTADQWVAATFAMMAIAYIDGGADNAKYRFFKNGAFIEQKGPHTNGAASGNWEVGRRSSGQFWDGDIAEVLVFNATLTDQQIADLYEGYVYDKWRSLFYDPPVVEATASGSSNNVTQTSHVISLPDGIAVGDRLFVAFNRVGVDSVATWPSGWNQLANLDYSGTGRRLEVRYHDVDGTEGFDGTGDTITITTPDARASSHASCRVTSYQPGSVPSFGTATGTGTTDNPPNLAPAAGIADYLWLTFAANNGITGTTYVTGPTGYVLWHTGAVSSPVAGAWAQRRVASEDPGTFAHGLSVTWGAYTIAVAPYVPRRNPIVTPSQAAQRAASW